MEGKDLILLSFLVALFIFACATNKRGLAAPIVFLFSFLTDNQFIKGFSLFAFVVLVVVDCKQKGKESVFSKYNIYSKDCVLPRRTIIIISLIGVIISMLALVGIIIGRRPRIQGGDNDAPRSSEYPPPGSDW